jgi:hypothetical protein
MSSTLKMELAFSVELLHGVTPLVSLNLRSENIDFCQFLDFRQEKVTDVRRAADRGFGPQQKKKKKKISSLLPRNG